MNVNFTAPQPTIVTREAAKASGAVWYYTGVPCRRGHTAMRYTRSGHCAGCLSNKKPGDVDMRTAPRVVQLRYVKGTILAQRQSFAAYLRACVDAFEHEHGPTVSIERV
jgi:hypothetical protein